MDYDRKCTGVQVSIGIGFQNYQLAVALAHNIGLVQASQACLYGLLGLADILPFDFTGAGNKVEGFYECLRR